MTDIDRSRINKEHTSNVSWIVRSLLAALRSFFGKLFNLGESNVIVGRGKVGRTDKGLKVLSGRIVSGNRDNCSINVTRF